MTDKEAMQMALETLDNMVKVDWREWDEFASVEDFVRWAKSRASFTAEALRARLAQPEQEPFEYWNAVEGWVSIPNDDEPTPAAWVYSSFWSDLERVNCGTAYRNPTVDRIPLYTAPPQRKEWVGLTDEEKHSAVWTGGEFGDGMLWAEKLLKERNT